MAVLDTSFLIDLQRGRAEALRALDLMIDSGEPLRVPAIVAAEFMTGDLDETAALHALARSYEVVHTSDAHLIEAAKLARAAWVAGSFPGWPDVHVAAAARLEGTFVVTANARHFANLRCDHWDHRRSESPTLYTD